MKTNNQIQKRAAGFLVRFIAYWNDAFLVILPFNLISFYILLKNFSQTELIKWLIVLLLFYLLLGGIIWYVYMILSTMCWRASLGKRAFGLEVLNEKGENLTFKQSLFRFIVGYAISGMLLGLGFLAITRDKEKKGWHDQLAGTMVVFSENKVDPLGIILFISLLLMQIIFWVTLIFRLFLSY